ncbi:MAG: 4Fe-4S binding protein [Bacteroidota bacterium]
MIKKIFFILIAGTLFINSPAFCFLLQQNETKVDDEFGEFKEFNENYEDEFKEFNEDEFSEFSEDSNSTGCILSCSQTCQKKLSDNNSLEWILVILGFTVVAGVLIRYKATRNLRGWFLLASLFIIGFYKAGCTACPIGGFQDFLLGVFGYDEGWKQLIWFIAIIPITYLFGRVYCGWICHLGALQEFLYLPGRIKVLQTAKAQKYLRISRYVLLATLIIQIAVMGTKYWCRIDPFVNIYGFRDFYKMISGTIIFDSELIIIIILVSLLLISSVLSFRPFCRTACPVGLIMGLVEKIPGASVIGTKGECAGCKLCNAACNSRAIVRNDNYSSIDNSDCIMCGDCIDACGKNGLGFFRKSKKHKSIVECRNECSNKN